MSSSPRARRVRLLIDGACALLLAPLLLYGALRHLYRTGGVVEIADDQVAVVVDALTGERRISSVPGYQLFVPWREEVYALDKSPDELVFEGTRYVEPNLAPQIEARGADGSRFTFERFTLQYALIADRADRVLDDAGPGDGFKENLVRAYARASVRDEIGRLAPEQVLRPDVARVAMTRAMERMNQALAPHGIEVLEVATPKPSFDKAYEDLINRRKQGDLEIERKAAYLAQLPEERAQRLDQLREDRARELDLLRRNLSVNQALAEREHAKLKTDADIYFANRVRAGEAAHEELIARAAGLRVRYAGLTDDRQREIENLERYGEFAVRAALVKRLASIEFSFVPYSRDAAPRTIEHGDVQAWAELGKRKN
jgi:hypothetical protein